MVTKAQYLCEALMRVPLFVKPPIKNFSGKVIAHPVSNIEIAATCLTAANAQDKITETMENHPFQKYWLEDSPEKEEYLYMEAHDIKGVILGSFKTMYYVNRPYGELYDLKNDPLEQVNLWDNPQYQQEKLQGMSKIIDKLFAMSANSRAKWNSNAPSI